MYNEVLKKRYIKERSDSANIAKLLESFFRRSQPFEEEYGADLCTLNTRQLQPIVDKLCGVTLTARNSAMGELRLYGRWCIKNNIPGASNDILSVKPSNAQNIKRRMVAGPYHLQVCLDLLFEREDTRTIDCAFRSHYWLAFAGLKEDETEIIRKADVDFESMCVRYDNKEYPIYREGVKAIKNCVILTDFAVYNFKYKKIAYMNRFDDTTLLSGIKSNLNRKFMINELCARGKKGRNDGSVDFNINYFTIYLSGHFYRMFERERAGFPVDFSYLVVSDYGDSTEQNQRRRASYLLNEYEMWKIAFN